MSHLPGLAFIKDRESRLLYLNDYHQQVANHGDEQWRGKNNEELFPPAIAAIYNEHDQRVLADGQPMQVIEPVLQKDGVHEYVVTKFLIPHSGESREPLLGGVAIDVTQLRNAERAARLQKTVLEAGVEASTDGVLVVASDGHTLAYNQRMLEMLGIAVAVIREQQNDELN